MTSLLHGEGKGLRQNQYPSEIYDWVPFWCLPMSKPLKGFKYQSMAGSNNETKRQQNMYLCRVQQCHLENLILTMPRPYSVKFELAINEPFTTDQSWALRSDSSIEHKHQGIFLTMNRLSSFWTLGLGVGFGLGNVYNVSRTETFGLSVIINYRYKPKKVSRTEKTPTFKYIIT